jgi:hypothetical protein
LPQKDRSRFPTILPTNLLKRSVDHVVDARLVTITITGPRPPELAKKLVISRRSDQG